MDLEKKVAKVIKVIKLSLLISFNQGIRNPIKSSHRDIDPATGLLKDKRPNRPWRAGIGCEYVFPDRKVFKVILKVSGKFSLLSIANLKTHLRPDANEKKSD